MKCIYVIKNNNQTIYVGSSKSYESRIRYHMQALKRGTHPNSRLQAQFNAGGNFTFHILEECPSEASKKHLISLEQFHYEALITSGEVLVNEYPPNQTGYSDEMKKKIRDGVYARLKKKGWVKKVNIPKPAPKNYTYNKGITRWVVQLNYRINGKLHSYFGGSFKTEAEAQLAVPEARVKLATIKAEHIFSIPSQV